MKEQMHTINRTMKMLINESKLNVRNKKAMYHIHDFEGLQMDGVKMKVLVIQLCSTVCNAMDCSLPGSAIHGILQARILEWLAISFSRGSFQSRDQTWDQTLTAGRFFTI